MTDTLVREWDDAKAIRVLDTFARARLRTMGLAAETELTPELAMTLRREFAITGTTGGADPEAEGDLARAALIVLADDPQTREAISALASDPEAVSFSIVGTVAIITAALIALQTHVKFERDKDGKVSLTVEKQPTDESLLKPLVTKLITLLPG